MAIELMAAGAVTGFMIPPNGAQVSSTAASCLSQEQSEREPPGHRNYALMFLDSCHSSSFVPLSSGIPWLSRVPVLSPGHEEVHWDGCPTSSRCAETFAPPER